MHQQLLALKDSRRQVLLSCPCRKGPALFRLVTYKVCLGAQPLLLVLVEQALQEVTGGHCPASRDLEWLVQNILIHLGDIFVEEGGLGRQGEKLGIQS